MARLAVTHSAQRVRTLRSDVAAAGSGPGSSGARGDTKIFGSALAVPVCFRVAPGRRGNVATVGPAGNPAGGLGEAGGSETVSADAILTTGGVLGADGAARTDSAAAAASAASRAGLGNGGGAPGASAGTRGSFFLLTRLAA